MASISHDQLREPLPPPRGPSIIGPAIAVCCGLIAMVFSAALIYGIGVRFPDFDLMRWTIKRILPVGTFWWAWHRVAAMALAVGTPASASEFVFWCLSQPCRSRPLPCWNMKSTSRQPRKGRPPPMNRSYNTSIVPRERRSSRTEIGQLERVGELGYVKRALELVTFTVLGLVGPLTLYWAPYCERCGRYMDCTGLGILPAAIDPTEFHSLDRKRSRCASAAREIISQHEGLVALKENLDAGRADLIRDGLIAPAHGELQLTNYAHRVDVLLNRCEHCGHGYLHVRLVIGEGENIELHDIVDLPADPELLAALLPAPVESGSSRS